VAMPAKHFYFAIYTVALGVYRSYLLHCKNVPFRVLRARILLIHHNESSSKPTEQNLDHILAS
jgi:hypothetical protein